MLIKSPLNYVGGKSKILPQLLPLFPKNINKFIDLFSGGGNVGVNVDAESIIMNDNLTYVIDLFRYFKGRTIDSTLQKINERINELGLTKENTEGYLQLRESYNQNRDPLDLFILSAFSFNHQIRFNNKHSFNTPFGKNRSNYNDKMEKNLVNFINALQSKNIILNNQNFDDFDFSHLSSNDFIYCDPPYLITSASYNDGKRGFTGWGVKEEEKLILILNDLSRSNVRFILSNVLEHNDQKNNILLDWIKQENLYVTHIQHNYKNSSYNKQNKTESLEVAISNYDVKKVL